jgi:hypothetical protein
MEGHACGPCESGRAVARGGHHGTRRRVVREQLGAPYVSIGRDGHRRITWRLGLAVSLRDEGWDGGAAMRDAFIIGLARSRSTCPRTPCLLNRELYSTIAYTRIGIVALYRLPRSFPSLRFQFRWAPWYYRRSPRASRRTKKEPCFWLIITLPWITRFAPFPPVSRLDAKSRGRLVSLPRSTTEEKHETRCRVRPLASFSSLYYEEVYRFLI